jgi:hypothetical protein
MLAVLIGWCRNIEWLLNRFRPFPVPTNVMP